MNSRLVNLGNEFHIFEADWNENRVHRKDRRRPVFQFRDQPGDDGRISPGFLHDPERRDGRHARQRQPAAQRHETWPQTMLVDYVRVYQGSDGGGAGGAGGLLANFDDVIPSTITEFDGAGYAIEAGPEGGDANALRITRDGGEVYAGVFLSVSGIPSDAGDQTISALVYSPTAGIPFVTKLEYGAGFRYPRRAGE